MRILGTYPSWLQSPGSSQARWYRGTGIRCSGIQAGIRTGKINKPPQPPLSLCCNTTQKLRDQGPRTPRSPQGSSGGRRFPSPPPGLSAPGLPSRMGQFRPWVTEVDRKNCDVNGLSLLSAQGSQGQEPKGQFEGRGPGGQRGHHSLGTPRPGRQGTWAEAASSCQSCPTLGPPAYRGARHWT